MDTYTLVDKPWGREEIIEVNEFYMLKKLTMLAGHRCSFQYHNKKRESIFVVSGVLKIVLGADQNTLTERLYYAGESVTIAPGCIHRMEGIEDAIYLEASTPELHDVVRLVDDYNRTE